MKCIHICMSVRLFVINLNVYNGFDLLPYTLFTLFFPTSFDCLLQVSPQHILCLLFTLTLAYSSATPTWSTSSFTTSTNLLWSLPRYLLSGRSIFNNLCQIYPLSLNTCPSDIVIFNPFLLVNVYLNVFLFAITTVSKPIHPSMSCIVL